LDLSATEVEAARSGAGDDATPPQGSPAAEAVQPARRRGGWWVALLAGALAGAAAGIGGPMLLQATGVLPAADGNEHDLDARLARLEAALREPPAPQASGPADKKALDDLSGRIARLETSMAISRPALDTESANRITTVEGDLKALSETVGILARRSDELASNLRDARQRVESTAAGVAELKAAPRAAPAPSTDKLEGHVQALTSRVTAAEAELARRAGTQSSDRSGRFAVAAAALAAAVDRGQSFAPELSAVSAFAADPKLIAPLSPFAANGVPTTAALAAELTALVPALREAAGQSRQGGGFLEKLQANAGKLVRIHPTEETPGSDPAAIVDRIEIKAGKGDVAGALAELAALPAAARAPAAGWTEKAQARAAAVDAGRRLAADALAGLNK
jgi:hypothetical protein